MKWKVYIQLNNNSSIGTLCKDYSRVQEFLSNVSNPKTVKSIKVERRKG